ncbi:DUF4118 domain-containing protein [Jiangella alkaliphila]|uniref:Sensor protein KdpD transmembrane domain-containing protein n=1 Tax=Jiangella alkaliphila TaxID=419479 RepID=A0A1H2L2U2_9ACTN|nr:DUF4118 domain-containing protein [Jiangella alkaliphila]SDU75357.1 protein of unknown function [Jiangella alkaliphila]
MRTRSLPILALAFVVPLAACALLALFRDDIANTNAALVLVLLVVAAAATGSRSAGIVAALSSAAWFDFFLTRPYQTFAIDDRDDIETAVLLTLVGLAVTEIALWGRRQQAGASVRAGYLSGVVSAAELVASGSAPAPAIVEHVGRQITAVLDIDGARFEAGTGRGREYPRLNRDGTVTRNGVPVDVARDGLPVNDEIELPVEFGGTVRGRFYLTAATGVARPTLEQRLVAVTLAEQVGAVAGVSPESGPGAGGSSRSARTAR